MKHTPFSSGSLRSMDRAVPSRCPYCPAEAPPHWSRWGSYKRYAGDRTDPGKRVAVRRYWCKIKQRTFSLPPDGLLPYCGDRTDTVLSWLHALCVEKVGVNTLSRAERVARGTLRHLKARFLRAVPVLRLPEHEGAMSSSAFLERLRRKGAAAVVALFRCWKECEPKHSIVGIYAR